MGGVISRDTAGAAARVHDVVVVGGGILGAATALEAGRRGLSVLLLERDDFAGATSWSSLRMLHGGLRYLQALDFAYCRACLIERNWFCRNFPELIEPLQCLMPLRGIGVKRPSAFRLAFAAEGLIGWDRNDGLDAAHRLPRGRVLSPHATRELATAIDAAGLQGGALWHEARVRSPQRLIMEMLRWAAALGGMALNRVSAEGLEVDAQGAVRALRARDLVSGEQLEIRTRSVVNAAGAWAGEVAGRFGDGSVSAPASLAFNLLLDRPAPSGAALVVQAPRKGSQVLFLTPSQGRVLAGTAHAPWTAEAASRPEPTVEQVQGFLDDLNEAWPSLSADINSVARVQSGLLPVRQAGGTELSRRGLVYSHAAGRGPRGVVSISTVKLTTARRAALAGLAALGHPTAVRAGSERPPSEPRPLLLPQDEFMRADDATLRATVERLVDDEAALTLEDILLRRTDWDLGTVPREQLLARLATVAPDLPRREVQRSDASATA